MIRSTTVLAQSVLAAAMGQRVCFVTSDSNRRRWVFEEAVLFARTIDEAIKATYCTRIDFPAGGWVTFRSSEDESRGLVLDRIERDPGVPA